MVNGPDLVREMQRGEEDAAEAVLKVAFGGTDEAALVRQLRKSKDMAGENVLAWQGEVVGYFALSVMRAPKTWLCLAPVAMHPAWQGKGHGRRMIGSLLSPAPRSPRRS